MQIEDQSNQHHPTILIFDRVHVAISLDTHDTVERPATLSGSLETHASALVARWPGLTLRDIRMALLINPLFELHKVVGRVSPLDQCAPNYDELVRVRLIS